VVLYKFGDYYCDYDYVYGAVEDFFVRILVRTLTLMAYVCEDIFECSGEICNLGKMPTLRKIVIFFSVACNRSTYLYSMQRLINSYQLEQSDSLTK